MDRTLKFGALVLAVIWFIWTLMHLPWCAMYGWDGSDLLNLASPASFLAAAGVLVAGRRWLVAWLLPLPGERCPFCGYALPGPVPARCPECGVPVPMNTA